jgi:hypothetical protein
MRQMTKILLSAATTVCALGAAQHMARAGTSQPGQTPSTQSPPPQVPPQVPPPIPTDTPTPTSPGDPSNPSNPSSPTGTVPGSPGDHPTDIPGSPSAPNPTVPDANPPGSTSPAPSVPDPSTTATTAGPTVNVIVPPSDDLDDDSTNVYGYAWYEPALPSGIGVSTILGGGVAGFTDRTMRSTTSDLGGLWDLRVTIGSHVPLALDIGYVGSATNINGLPTGNKGTLIGTTVEGALRWNILPHFAWTPYVFAGLGWQRYDVTQTSVSLSDAGMNDHDNLLVFPLGTGVAWRVGGFVADVRGTFRAATDQDLVLRSPTLFPTTNSNDFAPMHTWEASAALGYEF